MKLNVFYIIAILFSSAPAYASESIFCSGKKYSIEVQVSISTGEIFDAIFYDQQNKKGEPIKTHLSLDTRTIDYKKRKINLTATFMDETPGSIKFDSLKNKGVLQYHGNHKLSCDWSAF
jgi:hypothetical protein